uniref:Polycystin cation channel PKD1/PKD2 domain-containing protein n=1 Tax=Palpitomonas bilix TaxID=652834 RepID=A0A7S3D431_9EUKA
MEGEGEGEGEEEEEEEEEEEQWMDDDEEEEQDSATLQRLDALSCDEDICTGWMQQARCSQECFTYSCAYGMGSCASAYREIMYDKVDELYTNVVDGANLSLADFISALDDAFEPSLTPINPCPANSIRGNDVWGEVIDETDDNPSRYVHQSFGDCNEYGARGEKAFEIWNYGAQGRALDIRDPDPPAKERYVGGSNRLIGGVLINQKRVEASTCDTRFTSLGSGCTTKAKSYQPYSVDPSFLTTSTLFNDLADIDDFYTVDERTVTGYPRAFFHTWVNNDGTVYTGIPSTTTTTTSSTNSSSSSGGNSTSTRTQTQNTTSAFGTSPSLNYDRTMSGYQAIFDTDLTESQASLYQQFLVDGFYIDSQTDEISVELVTFNPTNRFLTVFKALFVSESGGRYKFRFIIQSMSAEPYHTAADYIRLGLEGVFVFFLLINAVNELRDVINARKVHGRCSAYFEDVGNLFDLASYGMMIALVVMWVYFVLSVTALDIPERFQTYRYYGNHSRSATSRAKTSITPARFFEYDDNNHAAFLMFLSTSAHLGLVMEWYTIIAGVNVLLLVFRVFKLMHFQARMGLLTRTLSHAGTDLFHFIVLFMITFVGFSFMAYLLFGHQLREFMNLGESMITCFEMIVGNYEVGRQLDYVGSSPAAGMIFYWTYFFVVFLILVNILLAILVDSFAEVKNSAQSSATMLSEISELLRFRRRGGAMRYISDKKIASHLRERFDEIIDSNAYREALQMSEKNKNQVEQQEKDVKLNPRLLQTYLKLQGDASGQSEKGGLSGRSRLLQHRYLDDMVANIMARHNVEVEEDDKLSAQEALRLLEVEDLLGVGEEDEKRKEAVQGLTKAKPELKRGMTLSQIKGGGGLVQARTPSNVSRRSHSSAQLPPSASTPMQRLQERSASGQGGHLRQSRSGAGLPMEVLPEIQSPGRLDAIESKQREMAGQLIRIEGSLKEMAGLLRRFSGVTPVPGEVED